MDTGIKMTTICSLTGDFSGRKEYGRKYYMEINIFIFTIISTVLSPLGYVYPILNLESISRHSAVMLRNDGKWVEVQKFHERKKRIFRKLVEGQPEWEGA
jgi:hypothetical protein